MQLMAPLDAMCLLAESREHPMHVGGLQLFTPPAGAGPEYLRETYDAMLGCDDIAPLFGKRPAEVFGAMSNITWSSDRATPFEALALARSTTHPTAALSARRLDGLDVLVASDS
jgi:diacylglycerol O-acyltransferase / wax synthase